jgi:hypothetical protein
MNLTAVDMTGRQHDSTPFWEFYAVGASALLAYHSCDGTERNRITSYDFFNREFVCVECGERHSDTIYGEPYLRDVTWDAVPYAE